MLDAPDTIPLSPSAHRVSIESSPNRTIVLCPITAGVDLPAGVDRQTVDAEDRRSPPRSGGLAGLPSGRIGIEISAMERFVLPTTDLDGPGR